MEFVGNQINFKTVLATLTVAFFIGRVNLFEGTFPAAVALITVMVAVSTVYIYLAPVMLVAMATCFLEGIYGYGDMAAVIFCGVFFLFFHQHKFTINQRTAVAASAVVMCNCIYYGWAHILYLLSPEVMIKEVIAVVIYIRVFNTVAKLLFACKSPPKMSEEKMHLTYEVFFISIAGAIGVPQVVLPLWLLMFAAVQYCKGLQPALAMTGIAAVFWQCQGFERAEIFLSVAAGLLIGWYFASLVDARYRKTILSLAVFAVIAVSAREEIYEAAVAMAVFIAIPQGVVTHLWCLGENLLSPHVKTGLDLKLDKIKRELIRKRDTFNSLDKLYGAAMDKRQIISYQFSGMARTVDCILRELEQDGQELPSGEVHPIKVGSASYAFEDVSGDSSLSFVYGGNKQALIISDGMGKGSKAATESKLVVTTLSKLLSAGFDVDIAMKTVNAILMTGSNAEMFATVDLAIINRITYRSQIFKMGAASTFVKHNGKVSMLKRPALPAGIASGLKLEYIDVRLKKGDLLIMVSDGVTECDHSDPDCVWLRKRLEEIGSRDPDIIAELIVNKAAEKYQLRERDDLTVMVVAI